jgi:glycosyltransferase involved in cell wall biosynthesis
MVVSSQALAARNARAASRGVAGLAVNKLAQMIFRARAHFYRTHRQRQLGRPDQLSPIGGARRVNWRRHLKEIADMDAVLTVPIWRLEPDLIHVNDVYALSAAVNAQAVMAKRGKRVPMVYDAHEYVAGYPRRDTKTESAYVTLEKDLAPRFDAVVTVSEPIADAMWQDLKLRRRPAVVHNVPDLEAAEAAEAAAGADAGSIRTAAGVGEGVPLIVYSGVIQHQRNVPAVIKALPSLPGVHLAVICVPNSEVPLARALTELAGQCGVEDRVHLLEPVRPDQIAQFMSSADVGVDPMDTHFAQHAFCLPNKLFDYLHAGLAVAVSTNECERRFVEASNLGTVFDPGSTEQIAAAISEAIERRAEFTANAVAAGVLQRYSWRSQVDRLISLYQELVPVQPLSQPLRQAGRVSEEP